MRLMGRQLERRKRNVVNLSPRTPPLTLPNPPTPPLASTDARKNNWLHTTWRSATKLETRPSLYRRGTMLTQVGDTAHLRNLCSSIRPSVHCKPQMVNCLMTSDPSPPPLPSSLHSARSFSIQRVTTDTSVCGLDD